jgi:hypothetical protein
MENDRVYVKTGGGFISIDDFLEINLKQEILK